MRRLLLVVLCGIVRAQDFSANQYPIQAPDQPPLTQSVLFTTNNVAAAKQAALPPVSLVIGVMSSPSHFTERDALRSAWMQWQSLTDPKLNALSIEQKKDVVIRFVIGQPSSATLESQISDESLKYRDIVRIPIAESYFNLTLKTGEFLKWAHATFNFKWAMKCDDDSFIRLDLLYQDLLQRKTERFYMGKIWTGTPADRRIDKQTPWNQYASFAAGAGYVLSHDLVGFIVRNYNDLFKFPLEDVAVGTWLNGLDITMVDNPHFHSLPEGCDRDMLVQNPASPDVMKQTFFNAVLGIPCHAKPDPFNPATKNVTDHVLLELGIPKSEDQQPSEQSPSHDLMMLAGVQALVVTGDDEAEVDTMSASEMNSNLPSSDAMNNMNRFNVMEGNDASLIQASQAAVDRMNANDAMNGNLI